MVTIATNPEASEVMVGTGGAQAAPRRARPRQERRVPTVHHFAGQDVPVFLLGIYGKGEKANLLQAERNHLARLLPLIAAAYRRPTPRKGGSS